MRTEQFKSFNIDKSRPNILLLGNGLTYETSVSWLELIRKVSRDDVDIAQYEETDENGQYIKFSVPNTILTLATSIIDDKERHKKYCEALTEHNVCNNDYIKWLLELPFDAILTTNYTYELENTLRPNYSKLTAETKRKYSMSTEIRADSKYLLHTYNRLSPVGPDIWHIHGELRRPSSMILSHDEYARYVYRILMHNEKVGNSYCKDRHEVKMKSWVDYFILGNIYMLGIGMDFAEFDLWWLLGRRQRELAGCGEAFFYEPRKACNKFKQIALHDSGVTVETCGVDLENGGKYSNFYRLAIKDIEERINNKR